MAAPHPTVECPFCSARVPIRADGTGACPSCHLLVDPSGAPLGDDKPKKQGKAVVAPAAVAQAKPRGRRIADDDDDDDRDDSRDDREDSVDRLATKPAKTPATVVIANPPSLLLPILAIVRILVWLIALTDLIIIKFNDFRATQNMQLIEYLYGMVFAVFLAFCADRILVAFGQMSEGFRFWSMARRR